MTPRAGIRAIDTQYTENYEKRRNMLFLFGIYFNTDYTFINNNFITDKASTKIRFHGINQDDLTLL